MTSANPNGPRAAEGRGREGHGHERAGPGRPGPDGASHEGPRCAGSGGPVRVRVPATSANLGPGFDALGLALSLYDVVEARADGTGLSIEVSGEGAGTAGAGERHLVVRAMRETFARLDGQPSGIAVRCVNRIPHGRGLGSSAAAIVSGILAARALTDGGAARLPDDDVLRLATEIEGHPDNVAACLFGGLTIAWTASGGPRVIRLSPLPAVRPVVLIAPEPLATEAARRVLPETVPHADAAANAGRSALLIAALTTDPGALLDATHDLLHQPYRAGVMPATADLVRRLRAAGIPAVVSGAGPSVLAFLAGPDGQDRPASPAPGSLWASPGDTLEPPGLKVLDSSARETGTAWDISVLEVDRQGANIQSVMLGASPVGGTPQ